MPTLFFDPIDCLIHFLAKLHIALKAAHAFDPLQEIIDQSSLSRFLAFCLILLTIQRDANSGARNMIELRNKAVQIFSQGEIFRAIAYGVLKARAGRLGPGEIIKIGEFELTVVEDENGDGIVVQIIETAANMESQGIWLDI
jgi:hypothetical protein